MFSSYKLRTPEYRAAKFSVKDADSFIAASKFIVGASRNQGQDVKASLDFDTRILTLTLTNKENVGTVWTIAEGNYLVSAPDGEVSVVDNYTFLGTFVEYKA
jgi:hypothetical protein